MSNLTFNPNDNITLMKKLSQECYPVNPILADLTAAQAILESGLLSMPSKLALESNNLFGIKGQGTAGSKSYITKEFVHGKEILVHQDFAVNKSLLDSFLQHKALLEKPRYSKVLAAKSFVIAAESIYKAGYATDPAYTQKLLNIYSLHLNGEKS